MNIDKISGSCKQPEDRATFEHLVDDWATADGKDNSLSNIVLACFKCNNSRNAARHGAAIRYYRTKFNSEEEWLAFCRRAPAPKDFIQRFGVYRADHVHP
jgi:5-methylcytosine-specific restriction endonuclease McrA